ncbi:N-acetylneuraminate lyase-like isoform X1 [Pocillopora damicornis]|uniref:N-acetylneuraminate lyase-like isoform X1 n=1 Tax=Pocillopora damicornis TaxID=46731 RepID=UPI000F55444E|nr:N-acetylneuraminate lyase-like isoform X1 [Pocillopora damicornis]
MVYDSMTRIKGLIAATLTPFDDGGELNLSVIEVYAQHLQNENVKGLFVAGTTGESTLLTVEERKILAEKWIEVGKDRFEHIIIHVGTSNLKDSQELARHSENNRATAIALMATSFFTPKSVDDLVEYVRLVADCAPNTPLFYYHIPAWTHIPFLMEDFLKAAIPKIPTLAGVKFTSGDMFDLGRCLILEDQRFSIMFGGDEILISALAMGACASVGGTYNFAGKLHFRIMDAFDKGDMETARSEQYRSQAMVKLYCKYGGHAGVGKAIMRFLGLDLGPARSPLSLSESQEAQLRDELGNIGFFTWR